MREFMIVDEAYFPPHRCTVCGDGHGPFLDTGARVDLGGTFRTVYGPIPRSPYVEHHVYLCKPCAHRCVVIAGGLDADQRARVEQLVADQRARIERLEAELEEAKAVRPVDLAGLRQLMDEWRGRTDETRQQVVSKRVKATV